jgi:exodeoxyribonuclease V gamma subunit
MNAAQGSMPRRFELYSSNRMETLLDNLAAIISEPLPSPFDKEVILVQSKGLERWLVLRLAQMRGIWANGSFPFPNALMRQIFSSFLGPAPEESLFSPDVMAWRILSLLPACTRSKGFESIENYLSGDQSGLKAVQLSRKIADVFDQYTLYRPEMVLGWETGQDDGWQAQLWRELAGGCTEQHRAEQRRAVLDRLERSGPGAVALPARLSVFGIPMLPPFHLDILHALSRHIRVCLFLLNPCRHYWGDLATRRQEYREQARAAVTGRSVEESHIEVGNALLSSLGLQGRQFLNLLLDKEEILETSQFHDPGENNLLVCIQSDIVNLRDRGRDDEKTPLSAGDVSLRIHSLHSPMREMEALRDYFLSLFDEIRDLEPRDIVVMTPQIEIYAPFISAVFSAADEPRTRIPFSIADRSLKSQSLVIQAFLKMLRLCGGRFGATEVMDLLDALPVQARFELAPDDMETIQGWLDATGIRWGIDGADRSRFGVPRFNENSWQEGLQRLLIGYALPSEKDQFFHGILPYDDVEGSESRVLGRFADFALALFEHIRALEAPRVAHEWQSALLDLLERFIRTDEETEPDVQPVRAALHSFAIGAGRAGFKDPIGIEAVRYWLEEKLQAEAWGQGFLAGGVTFCEMLPMRSIPFRIVALVGMDSTAFPRQGRPPGFDLVARDPRPGDRSLRAEDRYLFLEALLSARERLYISYVGQSIQDNSEIPPSPLVNELLDYVEQGFVPEPPAQTAQEHLLVRHPLQAFSREYFSGGGQLFSYAQDNLEALRAWDRRVTEPAPFMKLPAGDPPEERRLLDISELKRFFRQPVEYFLRQRLGIRLQESPVPTEDSEPFSLDGLSRYGIEQEICARLLADEGISGLAAVVMKRGILPPGTVGEVLFRQSVATAVEFVRKVRPLLGKTPPAARAISLDINGFHLSGSIRDFHGNVLLHYRCADIKPKDQLGAWIDHLAWNAGAASGKEVPTILAGKDRCFQFSAAQKCREYLQELLEIYWTGLKEPLRFFPISSFAYAEAIQKQEEPESALKAAEKAWGAHSRERPGEGDEPYNKLAFGNCTPLNRAFVDLAAAILEPLLAHRGKR